MTRDGGDSSSDELRKARSQIAWSGIDIGDVEDRLVRQSRIQDVNAFWIEFARIAVFYRAFTSHKDGSALNKNKKVLLKRWIKTEDKMLESLDDRDSGTNIHDLISGFTETGPDLDQMSKLALSSVERIELEFLARQAVRNLRQNDQKILDELPKQGRRRELELLPNLVSNLIALYNLAADGSFTANFNRKLLGLDAFTKDGERFVAEAVMLIEPNANRDTINTTIRWVREN